MPTVWISADPLRKTRFHKSPECRQLTKRPARGKYSWLMEVEVAEAGVRPCLTCYPDAPRIEIRKLYCETCESRRPCEHNGGVRIRRRGTGRPQWVWPDTNQMPYFRKTM